MRKRNPLILLCVLGLFCVTANAQIKANGDAGEKPDLLWQKLEAQIANADRELDGVLGVAIEDLTTGKTYFLHGDDVFPQASSIKIAVLAELYRQAQLAKQGASGSARLDDLYTVQATDLVQDSDIMGGLTPGVTRVTNRDLATMMVAVSDNSATNILIDHIGMEKVNEMLEGLGLKHTRLRRKMMDIEAARMGRENISTPREMMMLLDAIYRGKLLNKEMTDDFFTMLATHKDSWIPKQLPSSLRIADKPGALEGVRNDSGIVFVRGRPFVLCVMTTYLSDERDGEQTISKIAAAAYTMFDKFARTSEYGRVVSTNNGKN